MDIFPTHHDLFGLEPVGSQQQAGEPCAREVVAGDTPACPGVQDPAVLEGSPSTPCQPPVVLQDPSNTPNMQGGEGLLPGSTPSSPCQWVRALLWGPTLCRGLHTARPTPSEEMALA